MKAKKNLREAKRALLLTAFLALSGCYYAQLCDSIDNHTAGWYYLEPNGLIQLGDGNLLCRNIMIDLDENGLFTHDENYNVINIRGNMYYWISSDGLTVSDSLFAPCDNWNDHLWTRLHPSRNTPQQFCNLDASVVNEGDYSYLNIAFFDDQMNYNTDMEVNVPLTDDKAVVSYHGAWLLDSNNDIILQYSIPSKEETHFVRFGLDGTLKNEKVFAKTEMPFFDDNDYKWQPVGLRQYSDTPLRYNFYGRKRLSSAVHVVAYELDAAFEILNTYDLLSQVGNYPNTYDNGGQNEMTSLEDGSALFVRNTDWEGSGHNESTGVLKYDSNGNVVKEVWFNPFDQKSSFCSDLTRDDQGNVYLTTCRVVSNEGGRQVSVIKMDRDLNVVWEYSGMNNENVYRQSTITAVLNEGGIAVAGNNNNYQNQVTGLFMTLLSKDKGNESVAETGWSLRPYLCYPNPVADRLNIHYSPDVKPVKVELLDLQGRLLSTQKSSLESIDMQKLPAGTYNLNVVLDNGKSYSDKVVKQ